MSNPHKEFLEKLHVGCVERGYQYTCFDVDHARAVIEMQELLRADFAGKFEVLEWHAPVVKTSRTSASCMLRVKKVDEPPADWIPSYDLCYRGLACLCCRGNVAHCVKNCSHPCKAAPHL